MAQADRIFGEALLRSMDGYCGYAVQLPFNPGRLLLAWQEA